MEPGDPKPATGGGGNVAPAWLQTVLKLIAATAIFSMAVLTFVDVIMRYFLSHPVRGVYEINSFLLGLLTMSALPLVTTERSHITVDLFDSFFRGKVRYAMQLASLVFQMGMIGFIGWRLYAIALREWNNGWVTIDLQISRAPILFALSAFAGLAALLVLVMVIQFLRGRLPVIEPSSPEQRADDVL